MNIQHFSRLLKDTLVLVLAGGRGQRLFPLTQHRTKGAVPFGGIYRLIDFTLSNCLHSGLRRIYVLPQYRFASLERHLRQGWSFFRSQLNETLAILPPQQRINEDWYKGTADAVYQNLYTLKSERPRYTLILSSDHIYHMDFSPLLAAHAKSGAALTIAGMEVSLEEARRFGVMILDKDGWIDNFAEKPNTPQAIPHKANRALASMGIYVFNTDYLVDILSKDAQCNESCHDFGQSIIPLIINSRRGARAYNVQSDKSDFYWRDIGTIDAYWQASMELVDPTPPFKLNRPDWPIHTFQQDLPPAHLQLESGGLVTDALLCPGVTIRGGQVKRSLLSPGVHIDRGAKIVDSVLLDGVRVGPEARIYGAIIDKDLQIPPGYSIGADLSEDFYLSPGGITVVPKHADLVPQKTRDIRDSFTSLSIDDFQGAPLVSAH